MPQNPLTNLTVEIDAVDLTLGRFQHLAQSLSGLMREVGNEVDKEHRDPVRWVVSDVRKGSIVLELTPQRSREDVPPDLPDRIAEAIADGIAVIEERAERPAFFSDKALANAKELARPVGDDVRAIRIRRRRDGERPSAPLAVTKRLVVNVDEIIGPQLDEYGSVEGKLEGLITHGKRRFFIWESLTGREIECHFADRIPLADVLAAYERRVSARGTVHRRRTGEKVSLDVDSFRVLRSEDELPTVERIQEILRGQ